MTVSHEQVLQILGAKEVELVLLRQKLAELAEKVEELEKSLDKQD